MEQSQYYTGGSIICKHGQGCRSVMRGKCRYSHPWLDTDINYNGDVYIMFHGTSSKNLDSIKQNGLWASQDEDKMMLGKGVYLTYHKEKANNYGDIIIMVQVRVGKVIRILQNGDPLQKTWQSNGYDSAFVPKDTEFSKKGFSEVCIKDPKNVKFLGAYTYQELQQL